MSRGGRVSSGAGNRSDGLDTHVLRLRRQRPWWRSGRPGRLFFAEGTNGGLFFTAVPNDWISVGGQALNGINAVGLG